jgi:flagellar basal-body rod modification protein FlgD
MATTTATGASTSVSNLAPEIQEALRGITIKENKQTLNQDDFLKLLTVQLQNQDPLKPMEDAQFTKTMGDFTKAQVLNSAQIYLGRQVTLDLLDQNGNVIAGTVSAVKVVNGVAQITIGGKDYATASVIEIKETSGTTGK